MSKTKRNIIPNENRPISSYDNQAEAKANDTLERIKYTLELVNGWINSADTKVSVSCGIISAVIAIILFAGEAILSSTKDYPVTNPVLHIVALIATILGCLSFLVSVVLHFSAVNPQLIGSRKNKKTEKKVAFSIFYEDIQHYSSAEEYINAAKKASQEDFTNEILREAYFNSKICSAKMHKFKAAVIFGIISIVVVLVGLSGLYLSYIL